VITKRERRYVLVALDESLRSKFGRIQIGAALVDGNYVVSRGFNQEVSHPLQRKYNDRSGRVAPDHFLHAEIHALVRSKSYDLTGCEAYVARLDRRGRPAMCRPCPACLAALADAGLQTIIYTTPQGIRKEKLQ
jgi:deoxycytidylate deaminase